MSDVESIERAAVEVAEMRKSACAGRKAFAAVFSPFVRAMRKAMGLYLTARDQGVSREDAEKGLELEIRGCWPKGVSKFAPQCGSCDDTGWTEHTCWERHRCGREVCAKNPERQHLYVEPCGCANGDRMRKKIRTTEDALAAVGRTAKKRSGSFSRIGR
jgi:hypothetical protein